MKYLTVLLLLTFILSHVSSRCINRRSNNCQNGCQTNNCGNNCNNCNNNCNNYENNCNNCENNCNNCENNCDECESSCENNSDRSSKSDQQISGKSDVDTKNSQNNLQNVTTVINITNVINNENKIHAPIHVNSTNLNTITLDLEEAISQHGQGGSNYRPPPPPPGRYPCCYVLYPKNCTNNTCEIRRHKECSPICTSPVVVPIGPPPPPPYFPPPSPCQQPCNTCPQPCPTCPQPCPYFQQNLPYYPYQNISYDNNTFPPGFPIPIPFPHQNASDATEPLPPQPIDPGPEHFPLFPSYLRNQRQSPQQNQRQSNYSCHFIHRYPWIKCRPNYVIEKCGDCFFCKGKFNPTDCFPKCSAVCQDLLFINSLSDIKCKQVNKKLRCN